MTYCLGIRTSEGIVGLSDTRITSGTETTTSKKLYCVNRNKHAFFIMTSGLRSVRDKAITYFREVIEEEDESFDKLYKAVNSFGEQVKRVAREDKASIEDGGMSFNLFSIVGGQLEEDAEPKLYLLYPQGNWIEIGKGTPFVIIGNTGFGNPILRRSLTYKETLDYAIKCAFLSFDATRISANDVDYPIDLLVLKKDSYQVQETRYEQKDLQHISEFWNDRIREAINDLPADTLRKSLDSSEVTDY